MSFRMGPAFSVPSVEGLTEKETSHVCQPFLGTKEMRGCNFSDVFFLWSLGSLALQKMT